MFNCYFFFQAEDGIRDLVRSRGLGDVYKRQASMSPDVNDPGARSVTFADLAEPYDEQVRGLIDGCLLYTSDAADDLLCVDLGGRRIIKKKKRAIHKQARHKKKTHSGCHIVCILR